MPASIIALDFDGVLVDSIDECLATMAAAFGDWAERDLPGDWWQAPDTHARLRRDRHFVRPAGEYLVLAVAAERGVDLSDASFDALRTELADELDAFEAAFMAHRARVRRDERDRWVGYHRPYPGTRDALARITAGPHCVVTTKDAASVDVLSHAFGFPFAPELVWDRARTKDKRTALAAIADAHGVEPERVHFIDDNPAHLWDVAPGGSTLYWAAWGYSPAAPLPAGTTTARALSDLNPT